jgi:hypothetical protein
MPFSSCYYIVTVTQDSIMAEPHINKWKKNHPPKSDGGSCYWKHGGDVLVHDNALPLFMLLLLCNYYYMCISSSSFCYYFVVATQDVAMPKPHINKGKKSPL